MKLMLKEGSLRNVVRQDYIDKIKPRKADLIIVAVLTENGNMPLMLVPGSDRAVELVELWGWDSSMVGFIPPKDPMTLLDLLPQDYVLAATETLEGAQLAQEITLPSAKTVLH